MGRLTLTISNNASNHVTADSASLGAALRAAHGLLCAKASLQDGRLQVPPVPYSVVLGHGAPDSAISLTKIQSPDANVYKRYEEQYTIRSALESRLIADARNKR